MATSQKAKKQTLDRLRSKKGMVKRIPVYLDSEVLQEHEAAKQALAVINDPASKATEEQRATVQVRFDQAEADLRENTVTLVLRRPVVKYKEEMPDGSYVERTLKGRPAYEYLIEQHPATDEQNAESQEKFKQDAPYDADTFAPALIAACCEDPEMTAEEVDDLLSEWNLLEAMTVFNACMEICNSSQVGSVGKGFGGTIGS
jgi:hypothetical protein